VVIFFSLSKSILPGYILTVTVACGILVALFFQQAMAKPDGKAARIICRAAITLAVLCFVVASAAIYLSPRMASLAKPLRLPVEEAADLGRHFLTPIILFSLVGVLGLLARFRRDAGLCFVILAVFPVLLFTLNLGAIQVVFNFKSARQLSQQMPLLPADTGLAFWECFPNGLPFYLNRTATLITADGSEITSSSNYILFRLKNDPHWPTNLVPVAEFDRWLAARKQPVYLLAHASEQARLEAVAGMQTTNLQQLTPQYVGVLLPAP